MQYASQDYPVTHRPLYLPTRYQEYIIRLVHNGTKKFWPAVFLMLLEWGVVVFPVLGIVTSALGLILGASAIVVAGGILIGMGWVAFEHACLASRLGASVSYAQILSDELVYAADRLMKAGVDPANFLELERVHKELRGFGRLLYHDLDDLTLVELVRLRRYEDVAPERDAAD